MLQSLSLDGTWKLRWADGMRGRNEYANRDKTDEAKYIDAQVPGEVHLDVWKAGWIADPYVGINCLAARWVEECYWAYRREFDAPADVLAAARVWLNFQGLDIIAVIYLNGLEVGRHDNAFYPCRLDVTGKFRAGMNVLSVHVESGLYDVGDKPSDGYMLNPEQKLTKRQWLRKPQCQFSWDWATRLINVGIFKPVALEWTSEAVRLDQLVALSELSGDLSHASVRVRQFVDAPASAAKDAPAIEATLTAELVGTGIKLSSDVQIKPGLSAVETTLHLEHPELWWPLGQGSQRLYTLRVTLSIAGQVIGERVRRIGFRHVRVNQDAHPQKGTYFIVEINGRKIFCKGGNFVPADMIFARIDKQRYTTLVDRALEANFNFLRVWGGGLYEADDFYDLCDEKGILVWQEFIFACSRYPATNEAFNNSVKAEATYNIRRLAHHASLIIWCGNNENEWGYWSWGFDRGAAVLPDHALYHYTLPRILAAEDPTRYYQPSSPYSPNHQDPRLHETGDQHPWEVGMWNTDFRDYRQMVSRFPNEGGLLGPTALPTMQACLPAGHQRVGSFAWQIHDNAVECWAEPAPPDEMIRNWIGKDPRAMSVEEFAYWAGLVQGEGLREYCDNFRRRMFDSAAAIFWCFNDCWPATRSWTIVDYYLRRTPAFHPIRRALQPVNVVLARENEQVVVFGVNDTTEAVQGDLRYGLFNLGGGYPLDRRAQVALAPGASTRLASFAADQWKEPTASLAFAMLERGGELLARNKLFQPLFRELQWHAADVRVAVADGRATFTSPTFAWGLCIDLDGEAALADNFFDIYPGIAYSIPWKSTAPPRILRLGNLVGG